MRKKYFNDIDIYLGDPPTVKTISLKILKCSIQTITIESENWYRDYVGKTLEFWNKPFFDDAGIESIWQATIPTHQYVYLKDTNYKSAIRNEKLKEIKKVEK